MARLFADENFPLQAVQALRGLGHDVITVADAGQDGLGVPDDEVLDFASEQARALLTLNRRDFIRLHRDRRSHAGIIVCTQDADCLGQAERIHEAIRKADSLSRKLIRVNRPYP